MDHPTTKTRILDAAERLFAELGFADTSLRSITAEAGANLAAVNYYFQSKEALLEAVLARRIGPINRERLSLLDACEAQAGDNPPPIEGLIRAFLAPVLSASHQGLAGFVRLFGRMHAEPGEAVEAVFHGQFAEIKSRFVAAFRRAMPNVPAEEMFWGVHFLIGAMAHTMSGLHHLKFISDGLCDPSDSEAILNRLVAFFAAGFRAPAPQGDPSCTAH